MVKEDMSTLPFKSFGLVCAFPTFAHFLEEMYITILAEQFDTIKTSTINKIAVWHVKLCHGI